MIRLFFCAAPASLFGGAAAFGHPLLGAIVFLAVFGLGLDVTSARPERGEI